MILRQKRLAAADPSTTFDVLRSRIEVEVERPAVIAITSSAAEDGKEAVAYGLATSLSKSGYITLFIDTSPSSYELSRTSDARSLEEIARLQPIPDISAENLACLKLSDSALQSRSNYRSMRIAFACLQSKFDFVVISTDYGARSSFAASVLMAANAVLVSVKTGRRQASEDARIARGLDRLGPRFLGVVALHPGLIADSQSILDADGTIPTVHRSQPTKAGDDNRRREVAEWPS